MDGRTTDRSRGLSRPAERGHDMRLTLTDDDGTVLDWWVCEYDDALFYEMGRIVGGPTGRLMQDKAATVELDEQLRRRDAMRGNGYRAD